MRRRLPFHLYRLAFLAWFVGGVVRLRPDAVHAHDAAMLLPGVVGARVTGALLVYDSHELATSVPYRERAWAWFVATIERLAVPRCAAVITVSDGIAERLRLRYRLRRTPTVVRNVTALRLPARDAHTHDAYPPADLSRAQPADRRELRARIGIDAEIRSSYIRARLPRIAAVRHSSQLSNDSRASSSRSSATPSPATGPCCTSWQTHTGCWIA